MHLLCLSPLPLSLTPLFAWLPSGKPQWGFPATLFMLLDDIELFVHLL